MRIIDLETWGQRIADSVRAGHPDEDSRVELKATWPTPVQRSARQLAAHANAANGSPILWVIGLHTENGVMGAQHEELTNWWAAIRARFNDGVEPAMLLSVNVPYEGQTLVGLSRHGRPPSHRRRKGPGASTHEKPKGLSIAPLISSARQVIDRGNA